MKWSRHCDDPRPLATTTAYRFINSFKFSNEAPVSFDLLFICRATGREVFDWILDQGYYSERDTSNVIRQVMEAVAYLHSLHIVHRNLKV